MLKGIPLSLQIIFLRQTWRIRYPLGWLQTGNLCYKKSSKCSRNYSPKRDMRYPIGGWLGFQVMQLETWKNYFKRQTLGYGGLKGFLSLQGYIGCLYCLISPTSAGFLKGLGDTPLDFLTSCLYNLRFWEAPYKGGNAKLLSKKRYEIPLIVDWLLIPTT